MPRRPDLPTFYYLDHFHEFLRFIKETCGHLLAPEHQQFIDDFEGLSKFDQCLIVRCANRSSPYIRLASIKYEEIDAIPQRLSKLSEQGWFRSLANKDIAIVMPTFTKPELMLLAPSLVKTSMNKATMLEIVTDAINTQDACNMMRDTFLVRNFDDISDYFYYLYFGNQARKLNQLSMRDLGILRTRETQDQVNARFDNRAQALNAFAMQKHYFQLRGLRFESATDIQHYYDQLPPALSDFAQRNLDRIQYALALELLPYNKVKALQWLSKIDTSKAQEKWVRESYKQGDIEAVEQRLNAIIDNPLSDHQLAFAEDFLARKYHKKRTSVLTDMLRESSQKLFIDEIYKGIVERGVVEYYEARNIVAYRTENDLWRALFGVFFWSELFDLPNFGFTNEFDFYPQSLKRKDFYEENQAIIEKRLNAVSSQAEMLKFITKQVTQFYGKHNPVFKWRSTLLEQLTLLIQHTAVNSLLAQLRAMIQNWHRLNDGYPDLMVIENGELRFEEIKSDGDQLRRNQLVSIQKLQENGFDVRITQVEWHVDPAQVYVVVDIETTGGRAEQHRITEVGMQKVQGGKVIDQWQSLINPQRHIPRSITQLTGIDNAMVANAPRFAEVADEIDAFTQNAVFVAHNVNFDYGFIKAEFTRIDRRFRRAKLCTVQQMRKHYKGLASYSLANLCKHFDIKMDRHHRAMSDAIAATHLLELINQKRIDKTE